MAEKEALHQTTEVPNTLTTESAPSNAIVFGQLPATEANLKSLRTLRRNSEIEENLLLKSATLRLGKKKPTAWFPISLDSLFYRVWSLLKDFSILYSLVTSMYFLAFEHPGKGMFIMDVIVWAFFVLDIFVCFFIPFEDDEGVLITSYSRIAIHYATTWLELDIFAIIPVQFGANPDIEYYFRMVRMFKITSALDLLDGHGLGQILPWVMTHWWNTNFVTLAQKHTATIIYLLLYICFWTYSMGCFWYWYSDLTTGFSVNLGTYLSVTDKILSIPDITSWEKMERSWYFMMTTLATIGYGDYSPQNTLETLMIIFILLVGVGSYGFIIGQFNNIVAELNNMEDDRVGAFVLWMYQIEAVQGKIDATLKGKMLHEYRVFDHDDRLKSMMNRWWESSETEDLISPSDPYLSAMPSETLLETKDYLFGDVFGKYRGFFGKTDLKYDLCLHFHPRVFRQDEVIQAEGEEVHEILFVRSGEVAIGPMIGGEFSSTVTFVKCVINEYSGLRELPSFTTYKATDPKGVFTMALPVLVFNQVLNENYPEEATQLFIDTNRRYKILRQTIQDHTNAVLKKNPAMIGSIDLKPWLDVVKQSVFKANEKEREKEFVRVTQRNMLKTVLSPKVEEQLRQELTRSQKWKKGMAQACNAIKIAYEKTHPRQAYT